MDDEFAVKRENGTGIAFKDARFNHRSIQQSKGAGLPILTLSTQEREPLTTLTQPQIVQLLPFLQKFAETGSMF